MGPTDKVPSSMGHRDRDGVTLQFQVDTKPTDSQVAFSLIVVGNVDSVESERFRRALVTALEAMQGKDWYNMDLIGVRFETKPGMRVNPLPTPPQAPLNLPLNDTGLHRADCGRADCYMCGPRQGAGVAKLISGLPRGDDAGMGAQKPHVLDRIPAATDPTDGLGER